MIRAALGITLFSLLLATSAAAQEVQPPASPEDAAKKAPDETPAPPASTDEAAPRAPTVDAAEAVGPVITLAQILERAETENLELAAARERIEQASNMVRRAWSGLLPQLGVSASYTRNSAEAALPFADPRAGYTAQPMPSPPAPPNSLALIPNSVTEIVIQPLDQVMAVGQATMPIFVMPAYLGIRSANDGAELAKQSVAAARNDLLLGTAQAYYGAVSTKRIVELARSQLEASLEQERVARARFTVGETPKVAFLRAGVERARAEQELRRAENAHASAKLALVTLTGVPEPFDVVAPTEIKAPEGSAEALVQRALKDRPDLAANRLAVEIAERGVRSAWWSFAPVISASGRALWQNAAGFTGEQTTWLVQLTAAFSIYDGGARYAELDDSRSRLRAASLNEQATVRRISQDVRTALLDLESARANLTVAREQESLAKENAELVRAQFEAGVATYLDVVDANNALFGSQVGAVTQALNVQVVSLRLSRSLGRLEAAQVGEGSRGG